MNLLGLLPDGWGKHKGCGEWAGPCPNCGGTDRFVVWPEHPSGATGGRFLCRGCGVQGDAVEFLRTFRGMSYREACEALRIEPNRHNRHVIANNAARKEWAPDPECLPSAGWKERAAAFVHACAAGVESGDGLAYLQSRGLTVETARNLGIGWNPADRYDRRADWGLDEEANPETGRPRKVWLPRGLVLPIRRKAGVTALLIRRADWKPKDDLPKYWQVKGSGNGCYVIGKPGLPVVLVESILDAVLVWHEARNVAAAVALTGATKKPDAGSAAFLRAAPLILWSLDFDEAGTKAWAWWREIFPGVMAWPCAVGKDPGDMLKAGVPIRLWVEAGIAEAEKGARQGEAFPLPCAPEMPQNAPCCANRTEDEPKSAPKENGPENEDKAAVVRWWKPWPMPGTGELPTVTIHRGYVRHVYEDGTTRFVGIAAAPMIPNGPLAEWMRAAPHPDPTPKGVHSVDILHRLAAVDTNIDALLGWGLAPHLQDGQLVIGGIEDMGPEDRARLERWLAHKGPGGEPRRERVIRALKTGRRCAA